MAAAAATLDGTPCVFQGQDAMIKLDRMDPLRLRIVTAGGSDTILGEVMADTVIRVKETPRLSEATIVTLKDPGHLLCFGSGSSEPQEVKLRVSTDNITRICRELRGFAGLPADDGARTFFVVLNPVSGSGSSRETFENVIRPALKAANVDVSVHLTTKSGEAREIARRASSQSSPQGGSSESPQRWSGIIVLGGDGTVMEAQEGNLQGPRLPLAVIPTGSDNSLAASLGIWSVHEAVLAIVKGPVIHSDVMAVHEVNDDGSIGDLIGNPTCICGIGFTADTVHEIHTHRWASVLPTPQLRTLFYGLRQFFCLGLGRHYTNVKYVPSAARLNRCGIPDGHYCTTCEDPREQPAAAAGDLVGFGMSPVTALSIGCMRGRNMSAGPNASLYPYAHFGDGALDVVAVGDVPEVEFFRRAFCVVMRGKVDTGYLHEYVKATEVHLEHLPQRSKNRKFVINCDGDPRYPKTNRIIVRVIPRAARLHAHRQLRIEPQQSSVATACNDAVLDALDGALAACGSAWLSMRRCFGHKRRPKEPLQSF